jgi:UDP-N-acetyl-D-glucosamine/UDP-N-acetyl-D-galactosamine dehydrogenase
MLKDISDYLEKQESISVIGLGYVGLPLAASLSKRFKVIGFDINEKRISDLQKGIDVTGEVSTELLQNSEIEFTCDQKKLSNARFLIIAVPTPINEHKKPDIRALKSASELVGKNMALGATVVYESTVYPGLTEEECIPILEKCSNLTWKKDFFVGYSPERINPGDKENPIEKITKVVSGDTPSSTDLISKIYSSVIEKIHIAPNIKTAEAAKIIENTQRDLNIALINELSIIFNKMGINTNDVLEAAGTKWNFIKFKPGLVGGHCIGVDPYYLTFKAEYLGYHPEIILAGRRINDNMGKYIAENTVKKLIQSQNQVQGAKVLIMGLTFKENISDIRNTKVIDIYKELKEYGVNVFIHDPHALKKDVLAEYNIETIDSIEENAPYNGIILSVKHQEYLNKYNISSLNKLYDKNLKNKVFIDIKGAFEKEALEKDNFNYWCL